MLKRHLDVVEAVADVAVDAEDPADVVVALDRRLDRAQLDPAVLRDRRDAGGQAARQAHEEVLDRRDPVVLGGEDLGVIGVEHGLGLVALLLAEAEVVLDRRLAVHAVLPRGRRPPRELRRLRAPREGFARVEQRLDVDSVVDGRGHRITSSLVVLPDC